jgi:hypothetical protein
MAVTTLAVAAVIVAIAAAAARRVAAALGAWLSMTALLSAAGVVGFAHGPAGMLPLPLAAMATSLIALGSAGGRALIGAASPRTIVGLQMFRLPVESCDRTGREPLERLDDVAIVEAARSERDGALADAHRGRGAMPTLEVKVTR